MPTLSQRRVLVFKIQKKLSDLSLSQLQTVASSIGDVSETYHIADLSESELYDLIVDYIRSEKLKALEDEGMTQLLLLFDLLNDVLSAPDTRATEPGNAAPVLIGDAPTHHHGHTVDDDEVHTPPSHMDRDTRTQPLHMDRDTRMRSFQGRESSSTAGMPCHIGASPLGRMNSSSNISDHVVRLSDVSALLPRREFKLHGGQISDTGSDISYNSLSKQMDEGLQEGFSEKSATVSVQSYGIKAASFLHTVYQGLNEKNSYVRHDLKPFLSDMQVSDDFLLEQVTKSTSEEEGRLKRMSTVAKTRPVTVSSSQHDSDELTDRNRQTKVDSELQARDAIKELTAQVPSDNIHGDYEIDRQQHNHYS
ncbi:hypothetical protein M9458_052391, partial [Cirrhinus mrigala]